MSDEAAVSQVEAAWDGLPAVLDTQDSDALIVDVDGFEGPLDLLLSLSRSQKVDLMRVSVLQLAEQYLVFVERARALRLELAADYLVMAAWLAYLKSRLLLPPDPTDDGPSAQDLAAHLAYQLERLSAMREAAAKLMARDQKGRDFFVRGAPETVARRAQVHYDAGLLDLMRAYARIKTRDEFRPYAFDRVDVFTMEEALDRLRGMIGFGGDWADLTSYLPRGWDASPTRRRAALAAHFAAILEMAKQGQVTLRQGEVFAPLQIRAKDAP
jgi:segregation and condensation protein A